MSTATLINEINALPPDLRKEVEDFVAFLHTKKQREMTVLKEREFGYAKGKVWLSDDFDEPLDEFKEYM